MNSHDLSINFKTRFFKFHDFSRPGKCIFKFHDFSLPCEPCTSLERNRSKHMPASHQPSMFPMFVHFSLAIAIASVVIIVKLLLFDCRLVIGQFVRPNDRTKKMTTVHFTTINCKPNTAKRHKESPMCLRKFIPPLTTLCMADLELLELLLRVFMNILGSSCETNSG